MEFPEARLGVPGNRGTRRIYQGARDGGTNYKRTRVVCVTSKDRFHVLYCSQFYKSWLEYQLFFLGKRRLMMNVILCYIPKGPF